jgi:hypothetical protein
LPEAGDEFPAGTAAVVSGWGVTDAGGASDVLMAVDVHIDSDEGKQLFYFIFVSNILLILLRLKIV